MNNKLYEDCQKEESDFALIEELLKQGADPMGPTDGHGWGLLDHIYGELVRSAEPDDALLQNIPRITELFLRYGMDISSPRIPYDDENSISPLFCFPENEIGIITLKLLLDAGLDASSVAEFWSTATFDQYNVCQFDPNDEEWHDMFVWMMKMIMLVASYDHVLQDDEGLYETVGCSYNTYDIHNFRNWDNYYYVFDTSRCERYPELYKSVVKIYDVETDKEVWKIGFRLNEGEF